MTTMATAVAQQGLTFLGYQPGPIDGLWGPLTEGALIRFLDDELANSDITSGYNYIVTDYEYRPSADGKRVEVTPDSFAFRLKEGAYAYQEMAARSRGAGEGTPRATTAPVVDEIPLAYAAPRKFWRWDNPAAWIVGVLGAAAIGGFGYQKGWFR